MIEQTILASELCPPVGVATPEAREPLSNKHPFTKKKKKRKKKPNICSATEGGDAGAVGEQDIGWL